MRPDAGTPAARSRRAVRIGAASQAAARIGDRRRRLPPRIGHLLAGDPRRRVGHAGFTGLGVDGDRAALDGIVEIPAGEHAVGAFDPVVGLVDQHPHRDPALLDVAQLALVVGAVVPQAGPHRAQAVVDGALGITQRGADRQVQTRAAEAGQILGVAAGAQTKALRAECLLGQRFDRRQQGRLDRVGQDGGAHLGQRLAHAPLGRWRTRAAPSRCPAWPWRHWPRSAPGCARPGCRRCGWGRGWTRGMPHRSRKPAAAPPSAPPCPPAPADLSRLCSRRSCSPRSDGSRRGTSLSPLGLRCSQKACASAASAARSEKTPPPTSMRTSLSNQGARRASPRAPAAPCWGCRGCGSAR